MIRISTHGSADGGTVRTEGLRSHALPEIEASVSHSDLIEPARHYLLYVANYLVKYEKSIRPGETLAYGYWLTKFESLAPELLEVWEYKADASTFVRGVSLTLSYWRDQHETCERYGAEFKPPRPDLLTVISEGVLKGMPVQGVRYPSPENMSGWWITTDLYNGDVSTLRKEHTYHVTAARPDLAKFLALPMGFRYDLSAGKDVWFDEEVLTGS